MPRLNRYKKKTDPDPLTLVTKPKDRERILSALRATEMYLFLGNVAIGITMMISIKYKFDPDQLRYQRTPAKDKPSEENVMHYLRKGLFTHLTSRESEAITPSIIRNQYSPEEVIRT